jgi:hypothetical protein
MARPDRGSTITRRVVGEPEGQSVKLQGIKSAKSKYEAFKRNNEQPPVESPAVEVQPGPDGTHWVHGRRYSPAALALYLRGERVSTVYGNVFVTDGDPWIAIEDKRLKAEKAETAADDDAAWRLEMVAKYYDQQARPLRVARKVAGTSEWLTD